MLVCHIILVIAEVMVEIMITLDLSLIIIILIPAEADSCIMQFVTSGILVSAPLEMVARDGMPADCVLKMGSWENPIRRHPNGNCCKG